MVAAVRSPARSLRSLRRPPADDWTPERRNTSSPDPKDGAGAAGVVFGWALSPAFGLASFARQSRVLHPRGVTYRATVLTHDKAPLELRGLGRRLSGPALIRFSAALWKSREDWPDVLGCAIRLRGDERDTAEAGADDQDILFATIQRPWTMPFAPFMTNVRDYLGNDYLGVSPFDAGLDQRLYLRLRPDHRARFQQGNRATRLAREVEKGRANLTLGASEGPYGPWLPVASISIQRVAHVDGEALRFHPFRQGRGIRPLGFVHGLRRGPYASSQAARPRRHAI
jgi:hypothetical protein